MRSCSPRLEGEVCVSPVSCSSSQFHLFLGTRTAAFPVMQLALPQRGQTLIRAGGVLLDRLRYEWPLELTRARIIAWIVLVIALAGLQGLNAWYMKIGPAIDRRLATGPFAGTVNLYS